MDVAQDRGFAELASYLGTRRRTSGPPYPHSVACWSVRNGGSGGVGEGGAREKPGTGFWNRSRTGQCSSTAVASSA